MGTTGVVSSEIVASLTSRACVPRDAGAPVRKDPAGLMEADGPLLVSRSAKPIALLPASSWVNLTCYPEANRGTRSPKNEATRA